MEEARLYVGNLAYVAQQVDVEQLFERYNIRIKNIDISIDPFTGRNPSYCFVDLDDKDDPMAVKEILQNQCIRGRPVKINLATKHLARLIPQPNNQQQTTRMNTQAFRENEYVFKRWSQCNAHEHFTTPVEEDRRLYVGGLLRIDGQNLVNREMRELFHGFEIQAVSKIIWPHPSKRAEPGTHFYCFVDLSTAKEAEEAARTLNESKTPHGGSYIVRVSAQQRPWKVIREQLSGVMPARPTEVPKRNLEGNWRCSM